MKSLSITKKQLEILLLLYRFRFLSSKQIQEILGHKTRPPVWGWLSDLKNKGYVKGNYNRTKLVVNTKPEVYHLTLSSREILKDREETKYFGFRFLYKEDLRKQRFITHCLMLADIYIDYLRNSNQKVYEAFPDPLPDAFIAVEYSPGRVKRRFLEIIDIGTPRYALREKIERYVEYSESGDWRRHHNTKVPPLIVVCLEDKTIKFLHRYIRENFGTDCEFKFEIFGSNRFES